MDRKQAKGAVLFLGIAAVIMVSAVWCYETYFVHRIEDTPRTVDADGSVSGTFYGTGTGFGGSIQVTLAVEHNQIVDCIIEASQETPDVGGKYIDGFQKEIVEQNGEIDAVSGATFTSNGVKAALQDALESAGLVVVSDCTMKPGTYIGKAHGFSSMDYVTVSVNVTEDTIVDLKLLDTFQENSSMENRYMCEGAFETLGSGIVAEQNVNLDAVSGATGSSNGIKGAVRDALKQAYAAGGADEEEAEQAVNRSFTKTETGEKTDKDQVVRLDYDVVVVGAGAAGTTASLTALDQGASVLNIEKTFRWGGQSMFTGGPKAYNPGITDEETQAVYEKYADTIEASRFGEEDRKWNDKEYRQEHSDEYTPVNEEAYKAVVPASGKGVETLVAHGMKFSVSEFNLGDIDFSEGMPEMTGGNDMKAAGTALEEGDAEAIQAEDVYGFGTSGSGTTLSYLTAQKYYEKVFEDFVQGGGDYLLNTTAKELIYSDETKNEIVGVRAYSDNGITYEIYAKAIVLATGGYGGNEELMDQWAAGGDGWIYYGWQGNDGDGIQMALDAGANPYNLEAYPMSHQRMGAQFITSFEVQQTTDGRSWSPNDLTNVLCVNPDGVYLTTDGENFISEDVSGSMGGFSGAMGTYYLGASFYVAYSSEQLKEYSENGISDPVMGFQNTGMGIPKDYPLGDWVERVLDTAVSQGWAWKVDDLAEGNKVLGLPEGSLEAAYAADNNGLNCADGEYFYLIKGGSLAISSCGGVEVNDQMKAVRTDGTVIENLFIAGNDGLGNIMATGAEYPIGGDAGMFVIGSGSIAGDEAAKLSKDFEK